MKVVCVIGTGFSEIGKGVLTASLALLLKERGNKVAPIKFDGYLNQTSGTMNPYHTIPTILDGGEEVFVLKDGHEADADLGLYERFLNVKLTQKNNPSGGIFYSELFKREEEKRFPIGKTLYYPDLVDSAIELIKDAGKDNSVVLTEIGGIISDRETEFFIEAIRRISLDPKNKVFFILLAPAPLFQGIPRTKIARQGFKNCLSKGINLDALILRVEKELPAQNVASTKRFCGIKDNQFFLFPNFNTIYESPKYLEKNGLPLQIVRKLGLKNKKPVLKKWNNFSTVLQQKPITKIGVLGTSESLDSYGSINEAILHAAAFFGQTVEIVWFPKEKALLKNWANSISACIVCEDLQFFSEKIRAIELIRKRKLPILGISAGSHLVLIEFLRNVVRIKNANTEELSNQPKTSCTVIESFKRGQFPTTLVQGTLTQKIYSKTQVYETHRHIAEIKPEMIEKLEKYGFIVSGKSTEGKIDFIEKTGNEFFVLTQSHPEFNSKPFLPHPLFKELLKNALKK